jgi:hypothetical protein
VVGKRNSVGAPIEALRGLFEMPGAIAINKEKCPGLVIALQNWAFPVDASGLPIPGAQPMPRSQHSHYCKAICYLVDYLYGKPVGKKKKNPLKWAYNVVRKVRL